MPLERVGRSVREASGRRGFLGVASVNLHRQKHESPWICGGGLVVRNNRSREPTTRNDAMLLGDRRQADCLRAPSAVQAPNNHMAATWSTL